jgi:hypothetical protein
VRTSWVGLEGWALWIWVVYDFDDGIERMPKRLWVLCTIWI